MFEITCKLRNFFVTLPTIKKMKQKNEKERFIRETVIKYFFDMSKSTYNYHGLGWIGGTF